MAVSSVIGMGAMGFASMGVKGSFGVGKGGKDTGVAFGWVLLTILISSCATCNGLSMPASS